MIEKNNSAGRSTVSHLGIRQPIVTVCGHVDHGKTSILDALRGTKIVDTEAGRITQKISFTSMPAKTIQERAGKVLEKFKIPLEIPGFLFIDTPGHAAFTNLRKRGGSLADIAILVIDINEGIKPQTAEVLQILKANKTPFIIALNKIDNVSSWKSAERGYFFENINKQPILAERDFEEKLLTLIGALNNYKIEPELYTKISDFTKNIAIVPCSAKTKEGISEILAILCALSQKFLKEKISLSEEGKGVILEVKKEKGTTFLESILYDGKLNVGDEIIVASIQEPIKVKIRNIQEALPLNKGFETKEEVIAATGIRIQIAGKENIYPGMPFQVLKNNEDRIRKEFEKEIGKEIETDKEGIVIKAESLGSLEALIFLLKQKQIPISRALIGDISKKDVMQANANSEEDKVILGFNVGLDEEAKEMKELPQVKIIKNEVVYKIIEDYEKWKEEKLKEIERQKLEGLPSICKLKILPYVFRNSSPAVFGVRVEAGIARQETELINRQGEKIGRIKQIQSEKTTMKEATKGQEVAISLPGVNFERELQKDETLYSNISAYDFLKFKKNKELLSQDEVRLLQEIAAIKRAKEVTWGA
jgi:translation initiation factor 5B